MSCILFSNVMTGRTLLFLTETTSNATTAVSANSNTTVSVLKCKYNLKRSSPEMYCKVLTLYTVYHAFGYGDINGSCGGRKQMHDYIIIGLFHEIINNLIVMQIPHEEMSILV